MKKLWLSPRRQFIATAMLVSIVFGLPLSALLIEEMCRPTGIHTNPYIYHDVAVTDVIPQKTAVGQGYRARVNVTAVNEGDFIETFSVTANANHTIIEMKEVALASGASILITFTWNTTGFAYGNYTVSANADQVPGETDIADNTLVDGWVVVTIPGDINRNFKVDPKDLLMLARAYGSEIGIPRCVPEADIDCDGKVDHKDLLILTSNYGKET